MTFREITRLNSTDPLLFDLHRNMKPVHVAKKIQLLPLVVKSKISFYMVFIVGVSCILYYFVVYLYVSGSGSITSIGEERANFSAVVYW